MSNITDKAALEGAIRVTGTAQDLALMMAWAEGVFRCIYGDAWEEPFKALPMKVAVRLWVSLPNIEA